MGLGTVFILGDDVGVYRDLEELALMMDGDVAGAVNAHHHINRYCAGERPSSGTTRRGIYETISRQNGTEDRLGKDIPFSSEAL